MPRKPYPILAPRAQIPIIDLRPTLTTRILTPFLVLFTLFIVGLCVAAGIFLGRSLFGDVHHMHGVALRIGMAVLLVACSFSIIYIILHFSASVKNEPVGYIRPPALKLHAYTFIIARITLVCWLLSIIASSIIVSKRKLCHPGSKDCKIQIGEIVVSCVAFVAIGVMLTALEACQYPFQLPTSNNLFGTVNCRVSSFGDDLVDSNLTSLNPSAANILQPQSRFMSPSTSNDSISTLHEDHLFMGNEKEEWEKTQSLALANAKIKSEMNVKRKPVPNGILEPTLPESVLKTSMTSMPGGFPSERPITALERVKSKPRGWGIDWLYLAKNTGTIVTDATATDKATNAKCMKHSDSAISLEENVGSECAHCASSTVPLPKQVVAQSMARPRNVMPSSSISDVAMRSPLSTMRTADSPDIAIKPDVALVPTTVPSSLDRITPMKLHIAQPLPIAILNEMMVRRPSIPPHSTGMPRPPIATEKLPLPPKHVTPLKRKPAENKLTKQSKSWKDSLPVRGGSFEIGRKPVAGSRDITSNKAKDLEPTATPKQKPSAVRPSPKSWKDSLPIRGGSIELERSSATIRDIFPNVTRGSLESKPPLKPSATPKQAPLTAKKKSENITQTPTKSPNTSYVIKKKSEEMKVPGAFVDYTKPEPLKHRPTSREIKIPGAFIDNISPEPDKSQEEETIRKKPHGVRPLKLRPKAKTKAAERAKPLERAKATKRVLEDEPETLYVPAPRGPRDRPFTRELFGRSNVGAGGNKRDSTQLLDAIQVEYTKVQPLKRLSIGEMSTGMGHLWED